MLPGQHHTRTGIASRVTARPVTICGRSSRLSLDLPWVRNPAAFPGSASSPDARSPRQFPAPVPRDFLVGVLELEVGGGGAGEQQVHFQVQQLETWRYTCFSSSPQTACSQSIARSQASSLTSPSPFDVHVAAHPLRGRQLGGRG